MVKAREKDTNNRNYDLSHFVVHTGSHKVSNNRVSNNRFELGFLKILYHQSYL